MANFFSSPEGYAPSSVHQLSDCIFTPVVANVHFGVPGENGDCLQIGICKVVVETFQTQPRTSNRFCRQAGASIFVNDEGDLQMFFAKEDIMPCTERAIFKNKWFPVPQAYKLPEELILRMDPHVNPVIAAGKYPITELPDGYLITF